MGETETQVSLENQKREEYMAYLGVVKINI
jgi:hypothetical protein